MSTPIPSAQTFRITTLCIAHLCIGFRTHYSPDHPKPAPTFITAAAIVSVSFVFVCALVILLFFILETFRRIIGVYFSIPTLDFQYSLSSSSSSTSTTSSSHTNDNILQIYSDLTSLSPLQLVSQCKSNNNHNETTCTCAVCLDDLSLSDIGRLLPCGHIFHASCIDRWILHMATRTNATKVNILCPLCKRGLLQPSKTQPNKSDHYQLDYIVEHSQSSNEASELV